MSDLKTTVPFTSEAMPGITGVVRKITYGARTALRKKLAPIHERKNEALADRGELMEELATKRGKDPETMSFADLSAREWARWTALTNLVDICEEEIHLAHLEECFISLSARGDDGKPDVVTIDGEPVAKSNLAKLPVELARELVQTIMGSSALDGDAAKNSQSPSTSGGAEGPQTNDSSAASASATDSTSPESAASTQSS